MDFIFPTILPDEWLAGYRSRIASWNGVDTAKDLAQLIGQAFPQVRDQDMTMAFIHASAAVNATTAEDLMLRHSCRHVLVGLKADSQERFQSERARAASWSHALYSPDQVVRSCAQCVAEDLEHRPFAYWRRSHQVPGLYLCPVHACPLRVAVARDLPPSWPDLAVTTPLLLEDSDLEALAASRPAALAIELLTAIVGRCLTLRSGHVAQCLRERLILIRQGRTSAPQLTKLVDAAYPSAWVRHLLPRAEVLGYDALKNSLLAGRAVAYQHVALIAGLVYGTADEALSGLQATSVPTSLESAAEPSAATA